MSELHISSLVVRGLPDAEEELKAAIAALPGAEIHAAQDGKIVVTLETEDEGQISARMNEITLLQGVLSATLVYHQVESMAEGEETWN